MWLSRLRIRGRLALLILVPLLATAALTVSVAVQVGQKATRAAAVADRVRAASQVARLVRALQQERLASVGLLVHHADRGDVLLAQADTQDAEDAAAQLGISTVDTVLAGLAALPPLRAQVLAGTVAPVQVVLTYSQLIGGLFDSVRLFDFVDGGTPQGPRVVTLDAVMRGNEGLAIVLAAMAGGGTPGISNAYFAGLPGLAEGTLLATYATPEELTLYKLVLVAIDNRLGNGVGEAMIGAPGTTMGLLLNPPSYPALVSLSGIGQYIEAKVINDAIEAADSAAQQETIGAVGFVGASIAFIVIAIVLGLAVARSVSTPVRRLTRSAETVARLAELELVRVADDDSPDADPVRLPPIEATGRDELADFARAFGRVQETAASLVERQVASRRNVALMFGHVGRRTQNLVGRQISLIDRLESLETEPDRLAELYRLDHISSRLRRSASSLVVLSGASGADEHIAPIPLDDVVRLGLAEIEGYTRVDVRVASSTQVAPALINDLMLLLAELMENATGFSPPGTRVVVTSRPTADGTRLSIVDHGLGMPVQRLAEENARLTHRERLDLAPTEVLGLFVVGRLARRHGLAVALTETPGGGVTAEVDVPARLLIGTTSMGAGPMGVVSAGTASVGNDAGLVGPGPTRPGGPRVSTGRALSGPSRRELGLLDRASSTVRAVQPWNAFENGARPALEAAPPRPAPVVEGRAQVPPPAVPRQRTPSTVSFSSSTVSLSSSTLNRRVPGASLAALEATGASRPVHLAPPSSAEQARDSLADFESGIARAMREVQQGDEG